MSQRVRDLNLETALDGAGSFGKFQLCMFALIFPVAIFHGARMTSSTFFLYVEDHRCRLPDWNNDTYKPTSYDQMVDYNKTIPPGDSCHVYIWNNSTQFDKYHHPINASRKPCPKGWVYDTSVVQYNALSQFNFVCDDKLHKDHSTMLLFLGSLIGSLPLGAFSDRYGRKSCLLVSVIVFLAFGIALPWSPNFGVFGFMQFMLGAASTGMFLSALVMGIELVRPKDRKFPGLVIQMFFTVGEIVLPAVFIGLKNWHWVELVISAPAALILSYYWLVPESMKWQMMKKKYDEVSKTLAKVYRMNDKAMPSNAVCEDDLEKLLQSYEAPQPNGQTHNKHVRKIPAAADRRQDTFWHAFKSRAMLKRISIICFNWLTVNMTFIGFIFNSAHLPVGSTYVVTMVGAAVEIPAHLTSLLLIDRLGRKVVHCGLMLLTVVASAAAIGVSIAYNGGIALTVLALVGKYGAAGLMGTSFLWTNELYPTSIRATGVSLGAAFGRAGCMIAPYIVSYGQELQKHSSLGTAVPFIVFGAMTLLSFLLNLCLPETNNRLLPDFIHDVEIVVKPNEPLQNDVVSQNSVNYGAMGSSSYSSDDTDKSHLPGPECNHRSGSAASDGKSF